jgi:hypothetical protein
LKRTGTTDLATTEARFWAKVDKHGEPAISWSGTPLPETCWNWTGALKETGYGLFRATRTAHQFSYLQFIGPIPPEHEIDHLCRNRRCVNPRHLEAVTQEENKRRASFARQKENA